MYVASSVCYLGSRLLTVCRTMRLMSSVLMFGVVVSGVWCLSVRISSFSSVVSDWNSLRAVVQGVIGFGMETVGFVGGC